MKSRKVSLPWLQTWTRIRTRNPITISNSDALRVINEPTSSLIQTLTAFIAVVRRRNSTLSPTTYQTLISLLAARRRFKAAELILSFVHRRRGLVPGPAVLVPLVEAYSNAGRHRDAAELVLRFPISNKVFSFLLKTLLTSAQLDVAESFVSRAADLGFQIQVRYYNALVNGFCEQLLVDDGVRIFKGMLSSGVSMDAITFTTLMNPLGKEGRILEANAVFGKMLVMGVMPDFACFRILFRMYWRNRMVSDAIRVIRAMTDDGVSRLDGETGDKVLGVVLKRGLVGSLV